MTTQFKNKVVTARKNHNCDWCGKKIKSGEKYNYSCGVCDGDFSVIKAHIECEHQINLTIGYVNHPEDYCLFELRDIYIEDHEDK